MPRAYTEEEIRKKFLEHCWTMIDYWDTLNTGAPQRARISGCVFSILAMLDGSNVSLPGFIVVPNSPKVDKEYYQKNGQNWYPVLPKSAKNLTDIAGSLHELFHSLDPKTGESHHAD